jgi:acetylornithine deacetylase
VTDCLGHVALLTEWLYAMAESGEVPERTIIVILISNEEEHSLPGMGLDYVAEQGYLAACQKGPVYWLDSADFGPTLATGSIATWELEVAGVGGHSGMPHNCVNALECAMAGAASLRRWFAARCPRHPLQAKYHFASDSSLKATMVECDNRKVTMIPGLARVRGDMRLVPFYDVEQVTRDAVAFIEELGARIAAGESPEGFPQVRTVDGRQASLHLTIRGRPVPGVACDLDSPGYRALKSAILAVRGPEGLRPWSMTGSLPMVSELSRQGFDVHITGFGQSASYHAPNEQGLLGDFADGYAILGRLLGA